METVQADEAGRVPQVMQGLRAGDLLLSRLIVVLERTRADALSYDHALATSIGMVIDEARGQQGLIGDLMSARLPEAANGPTVPVA
jgi:hypothetical protein